MVVPSLHQINTFHNTMGRTLDSVFANEPDNVELMELLNSLLKIDGHDKPCFGSIQTVARGVNWTGRTVHK